VTNQLNEQPAKPRRSSAWLTWLIAVAVLLGGAGVWVWQIWLPDQMALQVSLLKQQLKTDYKLIAETGRIQLGAHGLTHATLIINHVTLKHPIGHGEVPWVKVYAPIWPLLQNRKLALSEVVLQSPDLTLKPGWTDYVWPKPKASNDRPLQGGIIRVEKGYHLTLPDQASVDGSALVWEKLDMPNSPMHVQGVFHLPQADSPFEGTATFQHWIIEKAALLAKPVLLADKLNPADQKTLKQLGLTHQNLPVLALDWTPTGWKVQSQPAELTLTLDRRKVILNQLQATGRSHGKQITIDAARLKGQWVDSVAQLPAQPWQLLAQGDMNLTNHRFKAQTLLPKGTQLKGVLPQVGAWQFDGQIDSQWSGLLERPTGRHQLTVNRLRSGYGTQQGQLVLATQGNQWIEGYIRQLSGSFRQAAVRVQGRVSPTGFWGVAQVNHMRLTPQQLAGLGPLLVRPKSGVLNATIQHVAWANPARTITGQARLQEVVLPGYPTLQQADVLLRGPQVLIRQAVVPMAGGVLNARGQINSVTQTLALDAWGNGFDIVRLKQQFPQYLADVPAGVTGTADVKANITGTATKPLVNADITLRQLNGKVQGVALNNGQVDIQYRRDRWVARVLQGVVGYQGLQPVAIAGVFQGVGSQLQNIQLQTGGVSLADVSKNLGIPLQSGSANINVSQSGQSTVIQARVQNAKTELQGHSLQWDGQLTAHLPKPVNKLTAKDLNTVWINVPASQLQVDGMPIAVSVVGYPMRQMTATTQVETGQLWQLPALSNWVAHDTPPYHQLRAQWTWQPDLLRLDRLEARSPHLAEAVYPVTPVTTSDDAENRATQPDVPPRPALPPVYPLHQHVSLVVHPKRQDRWLQWGLTFADDANLSVLEPYLNPTYFKGLGGQLQGQLNFDLGLISLATGAMHGRQLTVPELGVKPMDVAVSASGIEGHLDVNHVTVPGVKNTSLTADLQRWNDWPMRLDNANLKGEQFHIGRFQNYIKTVMVDKISKQLVAPLVGETMPGNLVLPFEIQAATTQFNEVIYQNIILSDVTGYLDVLASSYTAFRQAKLTAADGTVTGEITLDPIANNFLTLNMHAEHVEANPMAIALLNVSNQLFGEVTGDIRFTTSGQTEEDNLLNTNGFGSIKVHNARIPTLTRVEALLTGVNIIRTGVLGLSLNNVMRILWPFEVNEFKDLSTDMQFTNGRVYMQRGTHLDNTPIQPLIIRNPNLKIEAEGSIGLIDANADMLIHGKMQQNVKGTFGKVGQISLLYLLGHIPGINLGKGRNLLSYIPGVGFVPGFGGPPQKGKVNYFTVRVQGPFGEPGSIRDLRWAKPVEPQKPADNAAVAPPAKPVADPNWP
jgi:hypothetical protein